MTLIVALKADGGIALGSDSRGTIGDPRGLTAINDTQVKLFALGGCGLGLAGASEMGAVLLDELQQQGLANFPNIDEAVTALVPQVSGKFNTWFAGISHDQRPAVLLTLAGFRFPANGDPQPMIYLLNSQANFAPQLFSTTCLAGVPQYAVYLVHRYYDAAISLEKAKSLAEYLIAETASQDPKVGGRIRIAQITPTDGYRELTEAEVAEIHQTNEELNRNLRQFFIAGGTP